MKAFEWDRNFVTGLNTVDRQHHRLVDLINEFGESMISPEAKGEAALKAVFDELADYAKYHFSEEEKLTEQAGVDPRHRTRHHQHHSQFVEQLSSMWSGRKAMANPAQTLHGFLSAWLGYHILGEDQDMARQIALISTGVSASDACDASAVPRDNSTAALLSALGNLYHALSQQNRDLALANDSLEQRIASRTAELERANLALTGLNRKLEELSNTDGLLGIANRRYFDERLDAEWKRSAREHLPLSLLMLDVDHFKRYKDTYGHQAGDECLKAVARAAASTLKRPTDLLARYGGEEMAVVLPNVLLGGATVVAQEIMQALSVLHIAHADSPVSDHVTLSIGAATMMPERTGRAEALISAADRGLYLAKQSGRDRICAG